MRAPIHRAFALSLLLLAAGCKHNLDSLFEDTVAESGSGGSGSGGRKGNGGNGGIDSDEDGGVDTAGTGGAIGSGGSGVDQPADPCKCAKLSSDLSDQGIENCCRGIAKKECGLSFGAKSACLPRMVPGMAVTKCPNAQAGMLSLDGCCRPDSRCGYQSDGKVLGAFGCVAREEIPTDFANGLIETAPITCEFECKLDSDCTRLGNFVCTPNPKNGKQRICAKRCNRDADCNGDKVVCALGNDVELKRVNAFCQPPIGIAQAGDVCTDATDCASGACVEALQRCTQICLNDNDCSVDDTSCGGAMFTGKDDGGMPTSSFSVCVFPAN